ncbi:hypothetical protein AAFG07_32040 [Bradyrhizobium sp. B097]|uniref:hypothetical protein n=1 Tax=Bradyrhizobium sp. B097 TaxID=3140244 RepID=UPI00318310B8
MSGNPAGVGDNFHLSACVAQPFDPPATVQGHAVAWNRRSSLVARTPDLHGDGEVATMAADRVAQGLA